MIYMDEKSNSFVAVLFNLIKQERAEFKVEKSKLEQIYDSIIKKYNVSVLKMIKKEWLRTTIGYDFSGCADAAYDKNTTHAQFYGWQMVVGDGSMAGTSGESKRLEAIKISIPNIDGLGVQYITHCQTYGWFGWAKNGAEAYIKR